MSAKNLIIIRFRYRKVIRRQGAWKSIIDTPIKDLPRVCGIENFNSTQAHVYAYQWSYFGLYFEVAFIHNEFPEISEDELFPVYKPEEARAKYPYLFTDTNPILYRRYKL